MYHHAMGTSPDSSLVLPAVVTNDLTVLSDETELYYNHLSIAPTDDISTRNSVHSFSALDRGEDYAPPVDHTIGCTLNGDEDYEEKRFPRGSYALHPSGFHAYLMSNHQSLSLGDSDGGNIDDVEYGNVPLSNSSKPYDSSDSSLEGYSNHSYSDDS